MNFILFCLYEKELRNNIRSLCSRQQNTKYSSVPSVATNQAILESTFVESSSTQKPVASGEGDKVALLTGIKV